MVSIFCVVLFCMFILENNKSDYRKAIKVEPLKALQIEGYINSILMNAGFLTILDIANSSPEKLSLINGISIDYAKILFTRAQYLKKVGKGNEDLRFTYLYNFTNSYILRPSLSVSYAIEPTRWER